MAKTDMREVAQNLFIDSDLTQKQIAKQLGVAEKTISKWKDAGAWEGLRVARRTTKQAVIGKLYDALRALTENEDGTLKEITSSTADSILKISQSIEKLEQGKTLANYVMVMKEFMHWLRDVDLQAAKSLIAYSQEFLSVKSKRIRNA